MPDRCSTRASPTSTGGRSRSSASPWSCSRSAGAAPASAFLVGFIAGESFYLVHIAWTALYLGPIPWIALSTLESLFWGVGGILITLAYRWVPRAFPTALGRLGLLPVIVAGLWVLREFVTGTWPYGGFSWGRVAESQSTSPLAPLVAWLGISGLSFVMVWLVAFLVELPFAVDVRIDSRALLAGIAVALVFAIPAWPATTHGTTRIAAVQGNGPAGYFDNAPPGAVFDTQVAETLRIPSSQVTGANKVDMVVWPEGSALPDPTRDPDNAAILDALSRKFGAPFVVGTITQRDDKLFNTSLQWEAGKGAVDYYDKKHPVPFGEYVPDRAFWRPFAPDLIDLIGRDYTPGTRDNVFDVERRARRHLDLLRHRRRPAADRHDARGSAGHPRPDEQRGLRPDGREPAAARHRAAARDRVGPLAGEHLDGRQQPDRRPGRPHDQLDRAVHSRVTWSRMCRSARPRRRRRCSAGGSSSWSPDSGCSACWSRSARVAPSRQRRAGRSTSVARRQRPSSPRR